MKKKNETTSKKLNSKINKGQSKNKKINKRHFNQ